MDGFLTLTRSILIRELLSTNEIKDVGIAAGASGMYAVQIAHRVYKVNGDKAARVADALWKAAKAKHQHYYQLIQNS